MQRGSLRKLLLFFFNDTATTEIYTLSLHDALPISALDEAVERLRPMARVHRRLYDPAAATMGFGQHLQEICADLLDRKSTRLNSSHANISYAVFCLKKKKPQT